jgi:hypothetical protein
MGAALPYISFAIKGVQAYQGYKAGKQAAKDRREYNEALRRNADRALLFDRQKIEAERSDAEQEKASAKRKTEREALIEEAKALNAGFGNAAKISQQIYSEVDLNIEDINRGFEKDMRRTFEQIQEAEARRAKVYNSTQELASPTLGMLGLQIAAAGVESYTLQQGMEK